MPWGNGTGPAGYGPMTGRAAGYCAGYPVPGYMNSGYYGSYYYPYVQPGYRYGLGYAFSPRPRFGRGRRGGFRGRGFFGWW